LLHQYTIEAWSYKMKTHFLEAAAAVAGVLAITAVLHSDPVRNLIYESALSGGRISARATALLGDIAAGATTPAR
jgi:energy-converting hydrogenase Eha subunit C